MAGGFAGFSTNSTMRRWLSMAMTPKALASAIGTSMQATVHCLPWATWSAINAA